MPSARVAYVHSLRLEQLANIGTHPPGRSSVVHGLIRCSGLVEQQQEQSDEYPTATLIAPTPATREELLKYHSQGFVDVLLNSGSAKFDGRGSGSDSESAYSSSSCRSRPSKRQKLKARSEQYGLVDDCAVFPEMRDYVLAIAGSSLTAASLLLPLQNVRNKRDPIDVEDNEPSDSQSDSSSEAAEASGLNNRQPAFDIVINLEGGRHHAQRSRSSGFCYVQDVVLAIGLLRKGSLPRSLHPPHRKPRILYLDLDVHFGDGVAAAFIHPYKYSYPLTARQRSQPTPSVVTLSLHHLAPGFFPIDRLAHLPAANSANPFTLSIPLKHAASNKTYARLWRTCVGPIMRAYEPDCVVTLLGMDALAGDKLVEGAGNWSLKGEGGVVWCMELLRLWREASLGRKLLVLGGGGYNIANAARGWTCATSALLGREPDLEADVPEHDNWDSFTPSFTMDVPPTNSTDQNDEDHLEGIERTYAVLADRISEIIMGSA